MIELDVETRRSVIRAEPDTKRSYLILGDFGGASMNPILLDRDNFPNVLGRLNVTLAGEPIRQLDDFHPDSLFQHLSLFQEFRGTPPGPAPSSRTSPRANLEEILRPASILERMTGGGDPFDKYLRDLTEAHAAKPQESQPDRTTVLGNVMRDVLRHPRVQSLEAAWRGLDFVIRRMEDESSRVYIAQFAAPDLTELLRAEDLTSTRAYSLLNSRKWNAVFGLFSFGAEPSDIELLGRLALLASMRGAPFIAEGSVEMGKYWDDLRSIPEAGYLGLALPRFLLRLPYGSQTSSIESFAFEEMPATPVHGAYLWGSPALACLALLTGPGGGADLDLLDLPLHVYQLDGESQSTPCAEVLMTEAQVHALMEMGMMPLISYRDADRIRLAGFRAINGKALPLPFG